MEGESDKQNKETEPYGQSTLKSSGRKSGKMTAAAAGARRGKKTREAGSGFSEGEGESKKDCGNNSSSRL